MFKLLKVGLRRQVANLKRFYRVLALESSCDDSCVALLEKEPLQLVPRVIAEEKRTLNSVKYGGVIPTEAHTFHQAEMASMISNFCKKYGVNSETPPGLICCTRGPGMPGSLSASLQLAKGLAVAWDVPLIGVHHMLGHLLTAKLPKTEQPHLTPPTYPFLSLLCSGGHTMLVLLKSIADHEVIIDTLDVAAGNSLDKCAREIGITGNMIGKELEKFVESIPADTKKRFANVNTLTTANEFRFQLTLPLRGPKHQKIPDTLAFSFGSFYSTIKSYKEKHYGNKEMEPLAKQFLAYKFQETIFDHIINRINIALLKFYNGNGPDKEVKFEGVKDFVCSGGVASNSVLREKLAKSLRKPRANGPTKVDTPDFQFHFPDLPLCTDNATMIGVAGIDLFETLELKSDLGIQPIRKWPLNELLSVDGWVSVSDAKYEKVMGHQSSSISISQHSVL